MGVGHIQSVEGLYRTKKLASPEQEEILQQSSDLNHNIGFSPGPQPDSPP